MLKNLRKYAFFLLLTALPLSSIPAAQAESDLLGQSVNVEFTAKIQPDLLAAVRAAETSPYDFMLLCKRLQVYGTPEAVSAIASQLSVPEKSHSARMALEIMPCPDAASALRDAARNLTDPILRAGVFNSLGMRQDAESVSILLPFLADANPTLASSAAFALARIGQADYVPQMMEYAKKAVASGDYTQAKDGLDANLMFGEFLRRNGKTAEAETIFLNVEALAPRDFYRYAACFQLLLNHDSKTTSRMTEWLTGSDDLKCSAALRATSFLTGAETADVLMRVFPKVSGARQVAVIEALGKQKDSRAQSVLLQAIASEDPEVASAGMKAIQNFTEGVAFGDLFQTAMKAATPELRSSTIQVLESLPASANLEVLKKLESTNSSEIALAVELSGLRRIDAALPKIRALAASGELSAIKALGAIAELNDISIFVHGIQSENAAIADASQSALTDACALIEAKPELVSVLSEAIAAMKGKSQIRLILCQMMNVIGCADALEALKTMANSDDAELQDCASNALGRTLDPNAAAVLLALAQKPDYAFANRALRGYLRVARQFPLAKRTRIAMLKNALACAACTDSERGTADLIRRQYQLPADDSFNAEQQLLNQLEIVSAIYGVEEAGKNLDVTPIFLLQFQGTDTLAFSLSARWNDLFTDPASGTPKQLKLTIRYPNGQTKELSFREGSTIRIPKD